MTTYTTPPCMECGQTTTLEVESTALYRWQTMGVPIQTAFPTLDAEQRELIKTGIHPACWDVMFADELDEEDGR